jgi:mannose-6-phosphate isomerase-like protein (cupin superfamily)
MGMRRVVAGTRNGKAVILSDGEAPRHHQFRQIPQMAYTLLWSTEPGDDLAVASVDDTLGAASVLPAPGATRFIMLRLPPLTAMGSADFDPAAAGAEQLQVLPGLAELFEPDAPGKHRTPTIDYVFVVEGELYLELDDEETRLGVGDVVVQAGSRHSWAVRTEGPAVIAAVMVGMPDAA